MEKQEFDSLFEKFVNGTCSAAERETVDSWFEVLPDDENYMADPMAAKARVWHKISAKTKTTNIVKELSLWSTLGKIAAVLVVGCAVSIYFLWPNDSSGEQVISQSESRDKNVISNNETTPCQVKLADSSEVRLESNSHLRIISMKGERRVVSLEGTAFFKVVRDPKRPFYVRTKNLVTRVLGTSFTVIALPGHKEEVVQVKTGKVAVFANTKKLKMSNAVTITPNHQVHFDGVVGKLTRSLVEAPAIIKSELSPLNETPVKKNSPFVMEFDEKPVAEIVETLKKIYGVNIIYNKEKLSRCLLTTTLKEENLYTRLEIICKAMGASYVVEGTTIEVMGGICRKELTN